MSLLRFNNVVDFTQSELDALIISGINTIQSLLLKEASSISRSTSIDIKKIKANQSKLYQHYSTALQNIASLWEVLASKRCFYTTGCPQLDAMIDGGILSGEITQIAGPSCSGKSQLAHQFALTMASQGKEVMYIDTDGSFSAERLAQMYDESSQEFEKEQVLKKVHVTMIFGLYRLLHFLDKLIEDLQKHDGLYRDVKLIIIDSYTNPYVDILDYQLSRNRERKQALLSIISSYNRALRTIVTIRPDIALVTTNITLEFSKCLWNNNCGLILGLEVIGDDVREVTISQSERVTEGNSCLIKLIKSGFVDIIDHVMDDIEM